MPVSYTHLDVYKRQLLCGAIHRLYGFDNVGFHLGADYMTFDIDGALTPEQIAEVENCLLYTSQAVGMSRRKA